MYSRKEKQMARKNDPFAVERRAKKKEKPEKRQKDTFSAKGFGFESKDSVSFGGESKKEKPKKEPKAAKAQKESSFGFEEKKKPKKEPRKSSKTSFSSKKEKSTSFDSFDEKKEKSAKPWVIFAAVITFLVIVSIVVLVIILPAAENYNNEIIDIEITREPYFTNYLVGDEPDYRGLVVTATRRNGETFTVDAKDCEISGFNSKIPLERCFVTVKYEGLSDFFYVTISEESKPAAKLVRIYLSPIPKTEYKVGEWLNVDGAYMVREYSDGSTVTVNLLRTHVSGWEEAYYNGPGTYTLTVKYQDVHTGEYFKTTYDITITE